MKHPLIIAAAAGVAVAFYQTVASAAVDEAWAKKELKGHGCLTCHAVDKKKVGPAYKDIAVTFKGKTPAQVAATMKTKKEHAGVLKKTADGELEMMIEWILSLAK
ncbi:MAG TPA: c-type cytochrome [Burkholderiales bacterium]